MPNSFRRTLSFGGCTVDISNCGMELGAFVAEQRRKEAAKTGAELDPEQEYAQTSTMSSSYMTKSLPSLMSAAKPGVPGMAATQGKGFQIKNR